MTYEQLVAEVIRLSVEERRALLDTIQRSLHGEAVEPALEAHAPQHSLLELEGLGAAQWRGIDAQDYVDALRREWDSRP